MISQCNVCAAVFSPKKNDPKFGHEDKIIYGCRICGTHWWKKYEYLKDWHHLPEHKGYDKPHPIEHKWKDLAKWSKTWRKDTND